MACCGVDGEERAAMRRPAKPAIRWTWQSCSRNFSLSPDAKNHKPFDLPGRSALHARGRARGAGASVDALASPATRMLSARPAKHGSHGWPGIGFPTRPVDTVVPGSSRDRRRVLGRLLLLRLCQHTPRAMRTARRPSGSRCWGPCTYLVRLLVLLIVLLFAFKRPTK